MAADTFSRKLDASGRIMIPIKLRERFGLETGKEYYFFPVEKDGRRLLCMDCGFAKDLDDAIRLMNSMGYTVIKKQDEEEDD